MPKTIQVWEIKVKAIHAKFTMSDDEGPDNDADMDRMKITLTAKNGLKKPKPNGEKTELITGYPYAPYNWSTSGDKTIVVGYTWDFDTETKIEFKDGGEYDINNASLVINVYGREYDTTSANEEGWGKLELTGMHNQSKTGMLDNEGKRKITVSSDDFAFDAYFEIEEVL